MSQPGATRCRVCAAEVPAGAPRCPTCSAPQGPMEPCPHCHGLGGISQDRELRWVCDLCGGPRVPKLGAGVALSGREVAPLRKADAARKARAGWRGAAIGVGILLAAFALFSGVLLLLVGMKLWVLGTAFVLDAPLAAFLAYALSRAGARGREIGPALDAAWMSAASDVARQSAGPVSAGALAQQLGIDDAQAEELIALVDVNEAIGGGPRARIAVDPPSAALGVQPTQVAASERALATSPTQVAASERDALATSPTQVAAEEAALVEAAAAEAEAAATLRKGTR